MSLKLDDIYPVLKEILPERNNFYACSYTEEYEELLEFGIDSIDKLKEMLTKHLKAVMAKDCSIEVDETTFDYFCEELGKSVVEERLETGYWYSWPALLRLAIEEEFGEEYVEFCFRRDGV
jgi:hypothetical protein